MEYKKYQHVCRIGTSDVGGLLDGEVYVFSKIDGTNGTLYLGDDGLVHGGSRRRELNNFQDNQGFYGKFHKDQRFIDYFAKHPTHRLFGEYLKPHTLKTYKDDAWNKFYVFDVCVDDDEDEEKVKYLSYEEYKPLLEEFGIDYIPLIKKLDNPTQKDLEELLRDNKFLIQENLGVGEGLVVKRYDFVNCYGRTTWGKLIADEYIERQQTKCATKQNDLPIEKRIINEYFSEAVVEKEYAKILSENPEIEKGVLIPRLLNICFYTLLTEESWNFVKQFKNPTVDFKKLRNEVVNKIKKLNQIYLLKIRLRR